MTNEEVLFNQDICQMSTIEKFNINDSEIINQKKQFIFEVSQTSDFVFPNEEYKYYIYIKNISGTKIKDFTIEIDKSSEIYIESKEKEHKGIDIEPDEIILLEMKASCSLIGEHIIHFVGYGIGTILAHRQLSIRCTRTYNNDTVLHRLHIYDFTPYEEKYTLEADNYSNEVTQIFKRQKLPYKSGEQPFKYIKEFDESGDRVFYPENIESQSFLDQYNEAKNTKEHVYQYISRENFTEDSLESYTGENLLEIFDKINKESDYFNAKFIKTGTNHLLTDFTQYAPDGFIYRMGLLNSEIYHNLGVIPTYSYMSDRLFRWAPSEQQLLDLIPKKRAMKWGENVWAGRGWIVFRTTTEEYEETEEFRQKFEDKLIEKEEVIGGYEDKRTAEEVVKRLKEWDEIQRMNIRSDIVKFNYNIYESLYDTGVFFVNIPVNKIPSNFYMLSNKDLYSIINRAKPYGTRPIINYIIEVDFDHHIEQILNLGYNKNFEFESPISKIIPYNISTSKYIKKTINCGGSSSSYNSFSTTRALSSESTFSHDIDLDVDSSNIGMNYSFNTDMEKQACAHKTTAENRLSSLNNILELLYQGNYNDISFKIKPLNDNSLRNQEKENLFEDYKSIRLYLQSVPNFKKENIKTGIDIEDIFGKTHRFLCSFDKDTQMELVSYSKIGINKEETIKKVGYQKIKSIMCVCGEIYNKKIIMFLVEDNDTHELHYFTHIIIQDVSSTKGFSIKDNEKNDLSDKFYVGNGAINDVISFETPFVKESETFQPKVIKGGGNWTDIQRLNSDGSSSSSIKNVKNQYISAENIYLYYDQINIPETSIINKLRFKLKGMSSPANDIYIEKAFNTNYISEEVNGYEIQLSPDNIQCYSHLNESSIYYQIKLKTAQEKEQDSFIKYYKELIEENDIFDEDIGISTSQYLYNPNNFVTINGQYWCELSDFTDLSYKLNEVESINLIIEGYNTEYERVLVAETLSETNKSSSVTKTIPSGYFREKINLLYQNKFLLELLRVRFRFKDLNHAINIFDTKIELVFKNKQSREIPFEFVDEINLSDKESLENESGKIVQLENSDYYTPADLNNGLCIELSFDDLRPGDFYNLNKTELEVIYTKTDITMMVSGKKYNPVYDNIKKSGVFGITDDCYLSGLFYNDVPTMMQTEDNVGTDNKGIKLQDTLYQSFETRSDNITSIEIFPYSFKGNPDETLKIGLYTNSNNIPGRLIKEVLVSGWLKNNEELKNLGKIKYNFNVDNLKVNEKYWFKIQVLNPKENNYYLLKGTNNTKEGFKLLADENNNYINTFSALKFNIYSKNLSQSFNNIPIFQEYLDNPYVLIGLHKGKGSIKRLQTEKYIESVCNNLE